MSWICENCGSDEIQVQVWWNPNRDRIIGDVDEGEKYHNWCEHCEDHVNLIYKDDEQNF